MTTANDFYLKLRTKESTLEIRNSINAESRFHDLLNIISDIVGIEISNLKILSGYPRKALLFPPTETLGKCGVECGDTLFVAEEENFYSVLTSPASSTPQLAIRNDEVGSNFTNTKHQNSNSVSPSPTPNTHQQSTSNKVISHVTDIERRNGMCGLLMKKVVPSDNSCLFTSFEFVVSGKLDTSASTYMRQLVATSISSQPEEYNEAILGQPNESYCKWITNRNSWGGAIELAVLSNYFGFEIAVVNSITGLISRFGEDKHYNQRVFLLFDGIHYDPLYLDFMEIGKIQTIFPTSDMGVYRQAEQLAEEAKSSRQFTDVNQFKICCAECGSVFVGQLEAQKHAEKTGHTSFSEVNS